MKPRRPSSAKNGFEFSTNSNKRMWFISASTSQSTSHWSAEAPRSFDRRDKLKRQMNTKLPPFYEHQNNSLDHERETQNRCYHSKRSAHSIDLASMFARNTTLLLILELKTRAFVKLQMVCRTVGNSEYPLWRKHQQFVYFQLVS